VTRPRYSGTAARLSWALVPLMSVASLAGLLWDGLYRDAEWARAAWFGNDLVTLFVAVPLLAVSLVLARRGSLRGELVWYAMLGYAVYNYAYYIFGARMNELFPLYVLLFVLPIVALILALGRLDAEVVAAEFSPRTSVRWISGYMAFTGVGLAVAWTAQWAQWVFAGVEPSIGEEAFTLIAALDLSLMVPFFLIGAVLLWRRRPWGYVLGAIMNLKGATYTLVLTAGSAVGAARGIEGSAGQVPVWGVWTLVGLAATVALLAGVSGDGEKR
jgi:hypothetical protein